MAVATANIAISKTLTVLYITAVRVCAARAVFDSSKVFSWLADCS